MLGSPVQITGGKGGRNLLRALKEGKAEEKWQDSRPKPRKQDPVKFMARKVLGE